MKRILEVLEKESTPPFNNEEVIKFIDESRFMVKHRPGELAMVVLRPLGTLSAKALIGGSKLIVLLLGLSLRLSLSMVSLVIQGVVAGIEALGSGPGSVDRTWAEIEKAAKDRTSDKAPDKTLRHVTELDNLKITVETFVGQSDK